MGLKLVPDTQAPKGKEKPTAPIFVLLGKVLALGNIFGGVPDFNLEKDAASQLQRPAIIRKILNYLSEDDNYHEVLFNLGEIGVNLLDIGTTHQEVVAHIDILKNYADDKKDHDNYHNVQNIIKRSKRIVSRVLAPVDEGEGYVKKADGCKGIGEEKNTIYIRCVSEPQEEDHIIYIRCARESQEENGFIRIKRTVLDFLSAILGK